MFGLSDQGCHLKRTVNTPKKNATKVSVTAQKQNADVAADFLGEPHEKERKSHFL